MASLKERMERLRERYAWLDHVLRMLAHYGEVHASSQAGAVTYFGFVTGKLRDLLTLVLLGAILSVSVVLTSAVTDFSRSILGWLGLDEGFPAALLLALLGHLLAIAVSTVLLLTMFRLLASEAHL